VDALPKPNQQDIRVPYLTNMAFSRYNRAQALEQNNRNKAPALDWQTGSQVNKLETDLERSNDCDRVFRQTHPFDYDSQ